MPSTALLRVLHVRAASHMPFSPETKTHRNQRTELQLTPWPNLPGHVRVMDFGELLQNLLEAWHGTTDAHTSWPSRGRTSSLSQTVL